MITGTTPFTTVIAEPSCLRYSTFNLFWNYLINWLLWTCLIYQAFTFALSVSTLFLLCTFQGPIFLISSIKACSSRHLAYGFAKHVADLLNVIRFLCYCHFILSLVNVLWIFPWLSNFDLSCFPQSSWIDREWYIWFKRFYVLFVKF